MFAGLILCCCENTAPVDRRYNPFVSDSVRVDKWLWAARFFKTRALARDAIKGGKVQIDGHRVKPGRSLKEGDCLKIRRGDDDFEVTVLDLGERRVSAALAQEKFAENPESKARREAAAEQRRLDYQARAQRQRRPDKRQRRQIVRFTKSD
jgi:ribosome-associated heat shock protein Hsp15